MRTADCMDAQDDFATLFCRGAQWVKHWPVDLAVPSSSHARGEIFSNVNGVPLHTTSYRPDMTDLLFQKDVNSQTIYQSICFICFVVPRIFVNSVMSYHC